jgi:hypothetical protein
MAQGRKTISSNFTSLLLDCSLFRILVERVKRVNTGNSPFQGGNPPSVDGPPLSFMTIKKAVQHPATFGFSGKAGPRFEA